MLCTLKILKLILEVRFAIVTLVVVDSVEDRCRLQGDFDRSARWDEQWQMVFNADKCGADQLC